MYEQLGEGWQLSADGGTFEVPTGWGQGRATFGGLVAAIGVALGRRQTSRELRVVHVQFLAPVAPGPLQGQVEVLREGRTTTAVQVRLVQEGRLAVQLGLTFVVGRPAAKRVAGPPPPEWADPSAYPAMPYLEGVTPDFIRFADIRWVEGAPPFSGSDQAAIGGYMRFHNDDDAASIERLVGLLDLWPTPTLSVLDRPAPSSSMTWTMHLLTPPQPGHYRFRYETVFAAYGITTAVGHVWAPDGTYAAFMEQASAVFDG